MEVALWLLQKQKANEREGERGREQDWSHWQQHFFALAEGRKKKKKSPRPPVFPLPERYSCGDGLEGLLIFSVAFAAD